VSGQQHAPAALYSRERPNTHFTGGWLGPRAGLDRRKISSPPGFDPEIISINIVVCSLAHHDAFHETLRKICSAVLERVGEDQLYRPCEEWRIIQRVKNERKYPTDSKQTEHYRHRQVTFLLQVLDTEEPHRYWLLARSQYSEGPATGHLDTGFSWFPYVYKQMLRWFPAFQVATTCFSCSPPDLNLVVTNFMFCLHVK